MTEYDTYSHAKTHLRYHVIFSTKYRAPVLAGIETSVYEVMRDIERDSDFRIIDMAVDQGNHIHLVLKFKPSLSIEQVVRRIKSWSTHRLWEAEHEQLRRHYWGSKRKLWTGGYFCSTIGAMSEDVVLSYVKAQQ